MKSTDLLSEPEPVYWFMIARFSALEVYDLASQTLDNSYLIVSRSVSEELTIDRVSVWVPS